MAAQSADEARVLAVPKGRLRRELTPRLGRAGSELGRRACRGKREGDGLDRGLDADGDDGLAADDDLAVFLLHVADEAVARNGGHDVGALHRIGLGVDESGDATHEATQSLRG